MTTVPTAGDEERLVERLRAKRLEGSLEDGILMVEAADLITRLRQERDEALAQLARVTSPEYLTEALTKVGVTDEAEAERLREEIEAERFNNAALFSTLFELVEAIESNSGAEPSKSVYDRALDLAKEVVSYHSARALQGSTKQ